MGKLKLFIILSPDKISKIRRLLSGNGPLMVIASDEFIQSKLKKNGISSKLLKKYAPCRNLRQLHHAMQEMYEKLCKNISKDIDYADLFQNHLCWEIQQSYYFISALGNLIKRFRPEKIYLEKTREKNRKRYSASICRLSAEFFKKNGVAIELI